MPIFNSIRELDLYLNQVTLPEIAEIVAEDVEFLLNETIEETVYSNINLVDTEYYQHTFGLRDSADSIVYRKGNEAEAEVYVKPKAMYSSYYDGSMDNRGHIVGWLNDGHKGFYKNSEVDYQGRNFIERTFKKMFAGSRVKKTVQNALKLRGYVISRTPSEKD